MVILRPQWNEIKLSWHTFGNGNYWKRLPDYFLKILLIARNVLIINTNWNGKMMKETN